MKTAILVDGGFYRRRAYVAYGDKTPAERADELYEYCKRHLKMHGEKSELYRIFYYDCPPMATQVYHPLTKKNVNFAKSATYAWSTDFFDELKKKRKVALRMGELSEQHAHYSLKSNVLNKLLRGEISTADLKESDFLFNVDQKGVDMRIGLDIASLSYKKQVDQIVLISGDSDFVSAAKLARREGIDFILDALHTNIKPNLFEHIDGLRTCDNAFKPKLSK
ncbi:MAG: NYN domain-containing protein [Agathobacter sp.]